MSRWNIKELVVYSHDNRKRLVEFRVNSVNIITGDSNTGKSAIIDIIDYVMGSQTCLIPEFIRRSSSWVGVLWTNTEVEYFIARQIPDKASKTSNQFFYLQGKNIKVPDSAEDIKANSTRGHSLQKFQSLLGIGDMKSETFDSATRSRFSISSRHVMPYMFLTDDIIINKKRLFIWDNDKHRYHFIDSLPYFVGTMTEEIYAKQEELKRIRKKYDSLSKSLKVESDIIGAGYEKAINLLSEAKQVGAYSDDLPEQNDVTNFNFQEVFQRILEYSQDETTLENNSQIDELREQENELVTNIREIDHNIYIIDSYMKTSNEYSNTAELQSDRLISLELLPEHSIDECPLCKQRLENVSNIIKDIKLAYQSMEQDLETTSVERRNIDTQLQTLKQNKGDLSLRLTQVRRQKNALIRESENISRQLDNQQRVKWMQGRVSLYLESLDASTRDIVDMTELSTLESRINELDAQVNSETRRNMLYDAGLVISRSATSILESLPFEVHYKNYPISFNPYDLTVGIVQDDERIPMVNIGADENSQSLHLSVFLAFHRYFNEHSRPVPGVIIIDQLTRPYYPEVDKEVELNSSEDIKNPKQYFDYLFEEVNKQQSLQLIILEHAYYKDDPKYINATVERWVHGTKLIPPDWPQK